MCAVVGHLYGGPYNYLFSLFLLVLLCEVQFTDLSVIFVYYRGRGLVFPSPLVLNLVLEGHLCGLGHISGLYLVIF